MSSTSSRPADTLVAPQPTIAVAWSIARNAVREAMPDLDLPPARRRGSGDVLLCITVSDRSCKAELRDTQTDDTHPIEISAVDVEAIDAGEFTHIVVREGGATLLAATMRHAGTDARLLYASTDLLERLGIRGGRYARPSLGA